MSEENDTDQLMEIIDIVDSASYHRLQLEGLLENLHRCQRQVEESAEETKIKLRNHFRELQAKLTSTLDERLESLLIDVDTLESTSLNPLIQCEVLIKDNIITAEKLLNNGKYLLKESPDIQGSDNINSFKELYKNCTIDRLPAVPSPTDVAHISGHLSSSHHQCLLDQLSGEGLVVEKSPVYIADIRECPGGLHISWSERDDESVFDISEFCLQYCSDNSSPKSVYSTVYVGVQMSYTIKGLVQGALYSFRVSGRGDGHDDWAPWSLPQSAKSSILHYQWSSGFPGHSTSNCGRTLHREGETDQYPPVVYSNDMSYSTGETIMFRILSDNDVGVEDGVALTLERSYNTSLRRLGSVCISAKGMVYIDGNEMKNKLPPLKKGSLLTFHSQYLSNGKVRVSADIDDKQVTFDWTIDPLTPTQNSIGFHTEFDEQIEKKKYMYFAASFTKEDWRISVE